MATLIRNNFTGGELSPALHLRPEMTKYQSGLRLCENFLIRPQGGMYSRPGTNYCGEISTVADGVRLIPFVFSTLQTYVLVFSPFKIEIIRDGAFLTSGGSRVTVATPYSEAQLQEIDFAQSADVMTLVHPSHAPRQLSRLSETNWQMTTISFSPNIGAPSFPTAQSAGVVTAEFASVLDPVQNPPFQQGEGFVYFSSLANRDKFPNDTFMNINGVGTPSSWPGNGVPLLVTGRGEHVTGETPKGPYLRVRCVDGPDIATWPDLSAGNGGTARYSPIFAQGSGAGDYNKTYRYVVTAVSSSGEESVQSGPQVLTTKSLSATAGIVLQWVGVAGAAYYRVYKETSKDSETFGWIGDANRARFTDFNIAPITSDAPPTEFVTPTNPAAVTYYQQRQLFAGMSARPLSVISSQVGLPKSVRQSRPPRDDDAFETVISSPEWNRIRYLVPLDSLLILTTGAEWRTTEGESQVFTPTTAGVRRVSNNGCAQVKPLVVDDSVLYVQSQGTKIREMSYSFVQDRFGGSDLTIFADHLFRGRKVKQMAYSAEPDGVLWCVMDDGSLLALTYLKEQEVFAWHRHDLGGPVSSVAVIPENGEDVVYFSLLRAGGRFVERIRSLGYANAETSVCLDSHLSYDGAPVNQLAGLSHLEGQSVTAVADGVVYPGLVVTSGTVTLPYPASKVTVGLPFTATAELLPVVGDSVSRGDPKSISRVRAYVQDSRGLYMGVRPFEGADPVMQETAPRGVDDGYGGQPLYTGMVELQMHGSWDEESLLRIEQRDPFPLNVLAVEYQIDVPRRS